jgi:hypothetical protein
MKKTIKSLLAIAITAFAFTACSDVPAPYDMPGTGGGGGIPEGTILSTNFKEGQGAWKVMDVNHPAGFVSSIWTNDKKYGMVATAYDKSSSTNYESESWLIGPAFDLSNEEKAYLNINHAANYFPTTGPAAACSVMISTDYAQGAEISSATWEKVELNNWPSNKNFTYVDATADLAKYVGKNNVTVAFVYTSTSSKAGTWEIASCSVTKDGAEEKTDDKNWGTDKEPISVAQALANMDDFKDGDASSTEAYVKGYITAFDEKDAPGNTYGNATYFIADEKGGTTTLEVYRGYGLGGEKIKEGDINIGDEVIVVGTLTLFKSTKEFKQGSKIYSLNGETAGGSEEGGGGGVPSGDTDGTEAKPYTVTDAIATGSGTNVFVKAYLVGWIEGQALATGAHFNGEATVASNILIADSPDETDVTKCMPIQLPGGSAVRSAVNLVDNPGNYKKEILLVGNIEKYFGVPGLKSTSYAKIGDTEAGTKPGGSEGGGGETPTPGDDILNASFANSQGDFTIENKDLGDLTYVWKADSKGYMKASAFANSTNHAAESWLISPAFSLKNATAPVMTFNNACNYVKEGTITDHIKVMVFDGVNWAEATIANLPNGSSWTFVDSTVDLKAYAGKENVKVAFKYVSTTAVAPTWEIKTVIIK